MPENDRPVPRNGTDVMHDLSLDARTVISLAYEDLLKPYIPSNIKKKYFELCISSRLEPPENFLASWLYRATDLEDFKLKHQAWEDPLSEKERARRLPLFVRQINPTFELPRSLAPSSP